VSRPLVTGFDTITKAKNSTCPKNAKSGWWFSNIVVYSGCHPIPYLCDHDTSQHTNLNGYYDNNSTLNQRAVILCTSKLLNECQTELDDYCDRKDDKKSENLISIKLTKTEMYLTRRR